MFVAVAPEILERPLSDRVIEGESAQFRCEFTATPYPVTQVTWMKENQPITVCKFS